MTKIYSLYKKAKEICKKNPHSKLTEAFEEVVRNSDEIRNEDKAQIITSIICSPFKLNSVNRNYK